MRLHRVLAYKELFSDLPTAQTLCDQLKDFALASGNRQLAQTRLIHGERLRGDPNFLHDIQNHGLFLFCQLESEPYPQPREDCRNQTSVNLDRMLDHQKAVLDELEGNDQESPAQAVNENMFFHLDGCVILDRRRCSRLFNLRSSA